MDPDVEAFPFESCFPVRCDSGYKHTHLHTYTLTQFSSPHRHSLYTTRKDINTRLLFGGKEYFDVLCDTIMAAEHSIMISSCDFMPELYLKRDKR